MTDRETVRLVMRRLMDAQHELGKAVQKLQGVLDGAGEEDNERGTEGSQGS